MNSQFQVGDICRYAEHPPNWSKMRELCIWSDAAINIAQQEWGKHTATVKILEVFEADEEEGEPETYKIEFLDNPALEDQWQGHGIATSSELKKELNEGEDPEP